MTVFRSDCRKPRHADRVLCRRLYCGLALLGLCLSTGCETVMKKDAAADKFAGRLPPQTESLE